MTIVKMIFSVLDVVGPLLGLLYCLLQQGEKVRGFYFLSGFLAVQVLFNGLAKVWMHLFPGNNIFLYKCNAALSFLLLSAWFLQQLKPLIAARRYQLYRMATMVAMGILVVLILAEDRSGLNSLSFSLMALAICFFCLRYFAQAIQQPAAQDSDRRVLLPVTASLFLYYSVCFFIFILYKPLSKTLDGKAGNLWLFHNLILFIAAILLAFFSKPRRPWNPSSPSCS